MQRRVEQAYRHRQAVHRLEDPDEVGLLQRPQLFERRGLLRLRLSARIMRCTSGSRSPRNMCSVRHRPMPSRTELPRPLRVFGEVGVGAHTQRAELVGPLEDRAERAGRLRGDDRHLADHDLAGRAVDRDDVALAHGRAVCRELLRRRCRSSTASAPQIAGVPMPRATTAAWLTRPPRLVRIPSAAIMPCRSSGEVSGRTRITRSPASWRCFGIVGGEVHLADRRTGRRVEALREHVVLGRRVELRVQQLVELRRLDPQHGLALVDQALPRPSRRPCAARRPRCACRPASGG